MHLITSENTAVATISPLSKVLNFITNSRERMYHRRARFEETLKIHLVQPFVGKGELMRPPSTLSNCTLKLKCFFTRKNVSKPFHALERNTVQGILKHIIQLDHLLFHNSLILNEQWKMERMTAEPSSLKITYIQFTSLKIHGH